MAAEAPDSGFQSQTSAYQKSLSEAFEGHSEACTGLQKRSPAQSLEKASGATPHLWNGSDLEANKGEGGGKGQHHDPPGVGSALSD